MTELARKFLPYCDNISADVECNADNCVDVADTYAIEFLDWCNSHSDDDWFYGKFRDKTTRDVLLMFKEEKKL